MRMDFMNTQKEDPAKSYRRKYCTDKQLPIEGTEKVELRYVKPSRRVISAKKHAPNRFQMRFPYEEN